MVVHVMLLDPQADPQAARPGRAHAVVIGGSMAGMLAARALADHFDRVTLLERDRYPDGPETRKGVPQARHIHVLLTSGRRALECLFPGLIGELMEAGALDYDAVQDVAWYGAAGWSVRYPSGIRLLGATRDLIDWAVRRRVLADPRITVRQQIDARGLQLDPDGRRVTGVRLTDRGDLDRDEVLAADLVVDASGRGSRAPQWLADHGFPRPRETVVDGFLGYSTRFVQPPANWRADWKTMYIQCAPPGRTRGGLIASVEGGRWIVTLAGGGKDYPPTDEDGFRAFARSLPDPRFAQAYEASTPLTPIVGTKTTENRLRHYEELTEQPEGFLVTGDAACAFNPVYGQGMSTAAVGALTLGECLAEFPSSGSLDGLAALFQRRLAKANARAWLLATSEDYRYEAVEGPPPGRTTRMMHKYLDRVIALTTRHPRVMQRFVEVIHLVRSPLSLFRPDILARALLVRR